MAAKPGGWRASLCAGRCILTESITGPRDGLFRSPSPLPDGQILVSWKPSDGSASFGLYRLDPATGQRELVFDDPDYNELGAAGGVRSTAARRPIQRRLDR